MIKILITGANGMLANDFIKFCHYESSSGGQILNFEIIPFDKDSLDITNISNIEEIVLKVKPDIIINFAAYTQVDDAEDIGSKICFDVNTIGVYNLAKITKKYNIDFITISTDYVFDGKKETGYKESDECNPINNYGTSKYLAELLALKENNNSIIIRTSWLYGGGKDFKNFVNTMIKLANTKEELKVINDQFGIPTYTKDLSFAIIEVINDITNYKGQILHFSNNSQDNGISWFDFASKIFNIAGVKIKLIPCSTQEYITKAKRPKFSYLINNSNIKLRNWEDGLKDYIDNLN